jgi:hypothetical protein
MLGGMRNIECSVEDQDKRFQISLDETPRLGEFVVRGGVQYVVASVTWNVSTRGPVVRLVLRELLPDP